MENSNEQPAAVVPEGSTQTTPEPMKITYSAEQQLHLEGLIKRAKSDAARGLQAELAQIKEQSQARETELALYRDGTSPELVETRKQLAQEKTARVSAEARQVEYEKRALLREEATREGVFNPNDTARLLNDHVVRRGTSFVVVDDNGDTRLSAETGEPLQVRDLVREFAAERPWAVRSTVRPGAGSHLAEAPTTPGVKLADLFGPTSNGGLANKLSREQPREYARLRKLAVAGGFLSR